MSDAYDIAREFCEGYAAALVPEPMDADRSPHWQAGYEVGYGQRPTRTEFLNKYLVSVGEEPMGIVRLAETPAEAATPDGQGREGD